MAPRKVGKPGPVDALVGPVDALVSLIQAFRARPCDRVKAGLNWLLEKLIAGVTSLIADWDSKHVVPKFLVVLLAFWLSFETRVEWAIVKQRCVTAPFVKHFVNRHVISDLYDVFATGNDFIIVEGGNRMGKSVAVATAIANLSTSGVPVRQVTAMEGESIDELLTRLAGITMGWQALLLQQFLPDWLSPPRIEGILKTRQRTVPTPVFVVESAELLSVTPTIKSLFNLAKEMADKGTGRFVFVFSPTDKMEEMRHFGSLSRATIIPVLDMTYDETKRLLADRGCAEDRINVTYGLLGGHLSHFASLEPLDPVTRLCRGAVDAPQFEADMLARLGKSITASMRGTHGVGACPVLCAVADNTYGNHPEFNLAVLNLVKEHVVRASLWDKAVIVDSPLLARWMKQKCDCGSTSVPLRSTVS